MATGRRRDEYDRTAPIAFAIFNYLRDTSSGGSLPLSMFHPLLPKTFEQEVRESHPIFLFG